jgi:RNA-directed DNA polymerase
MARDLTRIGEKARREPKTVFTSIYHYVTDVDHLRACYEGIERGKAPGIDGVTKEAYGKRLESNLADLSQQLARQGYKPNPALRTYIPKAGSTALRPLGLQCFEDKVVQKSMAEVLGEIYEADFLDCSYGYRPERTCHGALDSLGRTIQQQKINIVVEADIKGFFDHVNWEWLIRFLEVRIGDKRILKLIERLLKAGIMEGGLERASTEGVPQGGVLSALLSNVYLHYALDLWFARRFRPQCRGEAYLFRYADDFVVCFQHQEEAEKFLLELKERLGQFQLELEPSKTKLLKFGRFAQRDAQREGKKPESFDFLGFTHHCDQTRNGHFKVKRRTSKKKYRAKLREMKEWLRKNRSRLPKGELLRRAKAKLEGHLNYYAITDNRRMCQAYRYQVTQLLFKWMNRQSQRRSYTWERFFGALTWVGWPLTFRVRVRLNPCRSAVGSAK